MARCAICGRPTVPYMYIGAEAVGPKCAKRLGLKPTKLPKGVKLANIKRGPAQRVPETMDLFEGLDDESNIPVA